MWWGGGVWGWCVGAGMAWVWVQVLCWGKHETTMLGAWVRGRVLDGGVDTPAALLVHTLLPCPPWLLMDLTSGHV